MKKSLGIGHGAWGMGHRAWGMGHGAWGMGHRGHRSNRSSVIRKKVEGFGELRKSSPSGGLRSMLNAQ
ncbi:MAG: hypothetical protein EAZ73_26235 [Oscillatoriales cyanobacterium]|nr:MAG: hypothetical protein EAZ83_25015 [Oscillatoriales cyanobacterium]TAF15816.1 MAG: hypothetical protein EAZ73_26235 [Oscillatoriales cyanobacterium]